MDRMDMIYEGKRVSSGARFTIGRISVDAFWLVSIGLFIFPAILRKALVNEWLSAANLLTWIGLLASFRRCTIMTKRSRYQLVPGLFLLVLLFWFPVIINNTALQSVMKFFMSIVVPIPILYVQFANEQSGSKLFRCWLYGISIAMAVVFACTLVDLVGNYSVSEFFVDFYQAESLQKAYYSQRRVISYFGHPLVTAEITLLYYLTNVLAHRTGYSRSNELIYIAVSFVVMAMTGSKTGFALLIIGLALLNLRKGKLRYIVLGAGFLYLIYSAGVLDSLLARFTSAILQGDLTTGRNTYLTQLIQAGRLTFNWFSGHSEISGTAFIGALEYPILRLAYRYGITFSIIFTIVTMVIPGIKLVKSKNVTLIICWLLILIDTNIYDSIASVGDYMLLYTIFTCILLYMADYKMLEEG